MTTTPRPFVFDKHELKRDGDPLLQWVEAQTDYICKLYGYEREYVKKWVQDSVKKGGCSEFYDRKVSYIEQESPGNREVKTGSFYKYLKEARDNGYVVSPSQTVYKNPEENPSIPQLFTGRNAKLRSDYKKISQNSKVKGETAMAVQYNVLQANTKELNNSFSGANSSWFNALCNASGHQSLTSTCRSATSYANIICERFLSGNRLYTSTSVVLQELSNACLLADHVAILDIVKEYDLKIPTDDDVFQTAEKSFSKYFRSRRQENEIRLFISTMDAASRCAFTYLGDLYHLDKFNPVFVEDLFKELATLSNTCTLDVEELYLTASDDMKTLIFSLLKEMTKGKLYHDFDEKGRAILNNTIRVYYLFFDKYERFINALWRPSYLPSNMAYLRTMLRETILTSDTDSAIGTTQYWTKRITGSINFDPESYMVCFNLIYFVSESVANSFGKLCANMGVPAALIDNLGAKNEYYFPIYCLSEAMKHYFAWKYLEEGRVLPEPELEKKGVGYISARYAPEIADEFEKYIVEDVMTNFLENVKLTKEQILGRPIALEAKTRSIIRAGQMIYQTDNIKSADSYKQGYDNATYKQYLLWNTVFAPTYGQVDEPPYSAYKVPVNLGKKRFITSWIDGIEDRALAARLKLYLEEAGTEQMSAILVPTQIAAISGIPKEIVMVVDEMRATAQIMSPFYLALGGFGLFYNNNAKTKLITDNKFIALPTPPLEA